MDNTANVGEFADPKELISELKQLRSGIGKLTKALNDHADDRCPEKPKRGNKCLFGSPMTCCCWMFMSMIFIFFVFALISAVIGGHDSNGTCPSAGGIPNFKRM